MTNAKGDLIDACRVRGLPAPVFATSAAGPEHEPTFLCEVSISGVLNARGEGRNKRDAERAAAVEALRQLSTPPAMKVGAAPSVRAVEAPAPRAPEEFEDMADELDEDEGPWPVFPEVLAECLRVANSRVPGQSSAALHEVRDLALELYKGLLEDLGEYE
ncbi:MAG TPA: putative dsRNA-binding protein [Deinococcales bacterium]|nr:putative dsRNA-binding protein [Deinococcales bacterium]